MVSPWLLATTIAAAFLGGMLLAILSAIQLPGSSTPPQPAHAPARKWFLLTLIPMMLVSGPAIDKWGVQEMLFAGSFLAAFGLASLGMSRSLGSVLLSALLLAGGVACLLTASAVLMPYAFFPRRLAPLRLAHGLNIGFIIVGTSWLLMPVVTDWLKKKMGLRRSMLLVGLACLVPVPLAALTPAADFPATGPALTFDKLLEEPHLWLAGLVIFFYFPLEGSLSNWAVSYLRDLGYEARKIPWMLLGFWLVFLTARLCTGWFLYPGYEAWLVFFLVLGIAVTFGNLVGAFGAGSGEKGMLVMWACCGPIFPTLMGVVFQHSGSSATAFSSLYALGTAGSLFFQSALVSFASFHSVRATMCIPMALALVMTASCLVLAVI